MLHAMGDDSDEITVKEEEDEAGKLDKVSETQKKGKGKKGKKEKKKKGVHSLQEIPLIIKEKPKELEPNIKIEGLKNLKLTSLTQKILGCIVGEHVTAEAPWITVDKELIDENLYLHHESSDFLPVKDDLANYTDNNLLLGYDPDYIPYEGEDFHRFYIAVTEKAREDLLTKLEEERHLAEERLKNSVNKKILPWNSLGSEVEVDFCSARNTRPLIELELETDIDELLRPVQLKDRNAEDTKDGYVKIGPGRKEFSAILKKRVDAAVQAIPVVAPHHAQTDPGIPLNAWTQYLYDMESVREAMTSGSAPILQPNCVFAEQDYLQKTLEYNESFDLYTNDYPLLVKNVADDVVPCRSLFEEYQAFTDVGHCKKKLISSIAWHPMWTGIVALAYSIAVRCLPASDADLGVDEVTRDVYSKNPVLIWSFKDVLKPRLILDSPREVYTIAWCPTDPNILAGGCASGQIVIWDLKGKLEAVEGHEYLTPDQQRYRLVMESLMGWVKPQAPAQYVRPAAVSNIQASHGGRVTEIQWLPPYYEWNEYGRLVDIPVVQGRTSMQLISCGEDGVVMVWDLNKLPSDSGPGRPKKKKARKRPSALTSQISPLKAGDRRFKPIYILFPNLPEVKIPHQLTALSMKTIELAYEVDIPLPEIEAEEEQEPIDANDKSEIRDIPHRESDSEMDEDGESQKKEKIDGKATRTDKSDKGDTEEMSKKEKEFLKEEPEVVAIEKDSYEVIDRNNITYRETYRPILFTPNVEPEKNLQIATDEGDIMTISWEGFDFHKGEEITTEAGEILNFGDAVHDGPIVACLRSPFMEDLILTVGGKVIALWNCELKNIPLFWKSSPVRVTCGSWSPYRPCMFHIGRADGSLEVWDFIIRSDFPVLVQSLSGQVLTFMAEHKLPLYGGDSILGVADYNNSFRLLFFPEQYTNPRPNELQILIQFVNNEIKLRQIYLEWNEMFLTCNADELKRLREKEEAEERLRREAELLAEQEAQLRAKLEEEETKRLAKSRNVMASISDRYFAKLKEEREKQMQRVLMEKKRLDKSELMAKQQPILVMKQMEKEKRKKQRDKVRQQQKIFDKTVAMLFPEVVEKPTEGPTRLDEFEAELTSHQQELMTDYEELTPHLLKFIKDNPFNKRLKWEKVFDEGRERRGILDFPLYLRQKRQERYLARNAPRYKFTLGQLQQLPPAETYRRKTRITFKDAKPLEEGGQFEGEEGEGEGAEGEGEGEGEGEDEGDYLFAEDEESI